MAKFNSIKVNFLPDWISTPNSLTLSTFMVLFVTFVVTAWVKRRRYVERVNKIPGPGKGGLTILGNAIEASISFIQLCCIL